MTTKINTYEDLIQEKQRLQLLLQMQKQWIREDIDEIKEELQPIKVAMSAVGKITSREPGNWAMNFAGNKLIDLVVKKLILRKAGWLTRIAVPFFLKNVSSHVIAENKDKILDKLFSWIGKASKNGHHEMQEEY